MNENFQEPERENLDPVAIIMGSKDVRVFWRENEKF